MRQETGVYIVKFYDELANKVLTETASNFLLSCKRAKEWEDKHPGHSAVVSRILYNSNENNEKWDYGNQRKNRNNASFP